MSVSKMPLERVSITVFCRHRDAAEVQHSLWDWFEKHEHYLHHEGGVTRMPAPDAPGDTVACFVDHFD